jgi:hypothetical protein
MSSILQADVYVSSRLPLAVTRAGESTCFSPITCTLIQGKSKTVLVDAPISVSQTEDLARWIKETALDKDLQYFMSLMAIDATGSASPCFESMA